MAADALSDFEHRRELRRAVIASTIGTTIEWYDFLLYGIASGLVFAKLYFPQSDALTGTLQAYAVFFVGFVARPIGAFVFGHVGDRIGRKGALIATLLLAGLATVALAFVPSYEHIGIWGAIILVLLRFIQGIGVGGEWGGAVLMSMEWARSNSSRGFVASWPQFGAPAGITLATLTLLFFSWLSGDQFLVWGWRIPFLLSIVMVGVGLYVRLRIAETPVFACPCREPSRATPSTRPSRQQELILPVPRAWQSAGLHLQYLYLRGAAVLGTARLHTRGCARHVGGGLPWVTIAGPVGPRRPQACT